MSACPRCCRTWLQREVNEVHVEAGATLCGALLQARCVDEVLLYQAPCLLGSRAAGIFVLAALDGMARRPEFTWLERRHCWRTT